MISIKGLNKFFNKGRQNEIHVINNVDLTLPDKGMVAIFGKSGCGKTTLLNVIGGLDGFASGAVTIDSCDIRNDTDTVRNRYIGYIFQNYNLNKSESCFANVANALRLCGMENEEEIETRVTAALCNVGMEKYGKRTPDTLSGGQQQRIAIARAIVKNPRIVLADEPTGNLDENNTVMIMDLLKAISRDHLVLLVTHEAELVDYYCDMVIEISDGKVSDIKTNDFANGFSARDKNDIYLGELEKHEFSGGNTEIEYYGDAPEVPVRLKIVNSGGKMYIQINTDKLQILDEFSEVKLKNGVFTPKANTHENTQTIDMSKLPPIEGERFGHLFSFRSSVVSGYRENFKKKEKRGKKLLKRCMRLLAAVVVLMSAVFGTGIKTIIDVRRSYNHNVFYVYTPNGEVSEKLNSAIGDPDTGIDYVRLSEGYPSGDNSVYFNIGSFETFSSYNYMNNFRTNAVYMDVSLTRDMKLLAGKKDGLDDCDILISSKVADALLKKSTLGYITEYKDLIGLVSNAFTVDGKKPRIAGIVKSNESAIYLTELAMAKYVRGRIYSEHIGLASDYGMDVARGETVLAIKYTTSGVKFPSLGNDVLMNGRTLKVSKIMRQCESYDSWLSQNGHKMLGMAEYFEKIVKEENADLDPGSDLYFEKLDEAHIKRYFEYYEYYYSKIEGYIRECLFFEPNSFEAWLYLEKGVENAKFFYIHDDTFFKACQFKERNGRYPEKSELEQAGDKLPYPDELLKEYYWMYEEEFYSLNNSYGYSSHIYLVSNEDYIAFSKQIGESHSSVRDAQEYYYDALSSRASKTVEVDVVYVSGMYYTVVHSSDPELTNEWLEKEFADLDAGPFFKAVITPQGLFDRLIENYSEDITVSLIALAVILALMSVCMYFIMRSSLMNRIKEIGIHRAIGVSKKNLIFKFVIESAVLSALTVLVGYIVTGAFIYACLGISPLVEEIFYYPIWLAAIVLFILCALTIICGILPILMLLRKTPSEILAKYDI